MVDEIVRHQDGVITLPQARRAGLSQETGSIDRLVRSQHWRRLARGVYFVDDRPFTDAARIRGLVWSYGTAAAASGLAAAWWHGLSRRTPTSSRSRCLGGVNQHHYPAHGCADATSPTLISLNANDFG